MLTVDFSMIGLKPGMRVLDAGCGSGRHLCEAFRTEGVQVVGADLNWADLCKTRGFLSLMDREKRSNWSISRADVTDLPYADGRFDIVVCSEVLEHLSDGKAAVNELVRVLKPGGDLVVSVPRYLPERVCWALSAAYHQEPGGHIRLFKKGELLSLLENAGTRCWRIRYRHGLHAPYWWLRCLVGHKNEQSKPVRLYRRFLEWDIMRHPPVTAMMDRILNPLIGKSIVCYLKKRYH
jgi:SAM-dependent methyltransferase